MYPNGNPALEMTDSGMINLKRLWMRSPLIRSGNAI